MHPTRPVSEPTRPPAAAAVRKVILHTPTPCAPPPERGGQKPPCAASSEDQNASARPTAGSGDSDDSVFSPDSIRIRPSARRLARDAIERHPRPGVLAHGEAGPALDLQPE